MSDSDLDPTIPLAKVCTGCGERKVLAEFYKSKTGRYGTTARCKVCQNAYARAKQAEDPERARDYRRRYYQKKRQHLLERQAAYQQQERARRLRAAAAQERAEREKDEQYGRWLKATSQDD